MATHTVFHLMILQLAVCAMAQQQRNVSLGSTLSANSSNSKSVSPSGEYAFGFYPVKPQKLYLLGIWFDDISEKTLVWAANRDDPVDEGSTVELSASGDLNLFDSQGNQKFSVNRSTVGEVSGAAMIDNGNFVLFNSSSLPAWQSFHNATDTLLPGQALQWQSWLISKATNNYSSGKFMLRMQEDDNLVLYPRERRNDPDGAYWQSHTWTPTPTLVTLNLDKNGGLSLRNGSDSPIKVLYPGGKSSRGQFPARRMTVDSDGIFRVYVLEDRNGSWKPEWSPIDDPCSVKSACGLNGYCSVNATDGKAICSCPPGFNPVDEEDIFQGCLRNATTGCTAGFNRTSDLQAIQDVNWSGGNYSVLAPIGEVDCRQSCLDDCLCVVAIFHNGDHCYMKGGPLLDGRQGTITSTTFVKVSSEIRPAPAVPLSDQRYHRKVLVAGVGVLGVSAVFFATALAVLWYFSRVKRRGAAASEEHKVPWGIRPFTYEEIHSTTQGFREELGKGAFGTVFKGTLPQGRAVAVKQLNKVVQDGEKEFRTEVATIGTTHHKNLVQLVGFCDENSHRLLVYEYMSKGSLDGVLFGDSIGFLDWKIRVQIAIGIARGIAYLHEECRTQIIHCDIKPENILLDDGYHPKISDFGLSKLMGIDQTHTFTTARGTRGYLAPEWFKSHMPITVKADVYSFGIVLLEIVCCRKSVDLSAPQNEVVLVEWVYECLKLGRLVKLVERQKSQLDDVIDGRQLERMVLVGAWCIQDDPSLRPLMKTVVQMLDGTIDIKIPPPPPSFLKSDEDSMR